MSAQGSYGVKRVGCAGALKLKRAGMDRMAPPRSAPSAVSPLTIRFAHRLSRGPSSRCRDRPPRRRQLPQATTAGKQRRQPPQASSAGNYLRQPPQATTASAYRWSTVAPALEFETQPDFNLADYP